MSIMTVQPPARIRTDAGVDEKKQRAFILLSEARAEALAEGVDADILAHTALFQALSDLVDSYGEEAVAGLTKTLPGRIRQFEFSRTRKVQ